MQGEFIMQQSTLTILIVIAAIVALAAIGLAVHHYLNPAMPPM